MQIKMWKTLGSATLVAQAFVHLGAVSPAIAQQASAPASSAGAPSDYPGGTIEHALEKIFDGEGGEGGIGMTKLMPSFTVPALRSDQLRKAISGNTVRSNNRFAIYFRPNGKAEGWVVKYRPAAASECKPGRSGHFVDDSGTCLVGYDVKIDGAWRLSNDQICMPGIFHGAQTPPTQESCHYMALLLNNVVFFNTQGDMLAKGWNLAKGDVRDKVAG